MTTLWRFSSQTQKGIKILYHSQSLLMSATELFHVFHLEHFIYCLFFSFSDFYLTIFVYVHNFKKAANSSDQEGK